MNVHSILEFFYQPISDVNKNHYEYIFSKVPGSKFSVSKLKPKSSIFYDILEIISEFQNKAHNRHIELHLINIEKVNVMAVH